MKAIYVPDKDFDLPYQLKKIYYDGLYIDVLNGKKDMIALDYQASYGAVTMHILPQCAKLYAVEPREDHREALLKNIAVNGWERVTPLDTPITAMDKFFTDHELQTLDFFNLNGHEDELIPSQGFKIVADRIKNLMVHFKSPKWKELATYLMALGYKGRQYPSSEIVMLFSR